MKRGCVTLLTEFGWRKDGIDQRDHPFVPDAAGARPAKIDLSTSAFQPPIADQRPLSSCSAHAIGAMFSYVNEKEGRAPIVPSRLFIYYNERSLEGTVMTDSGAKIRDGIKSIAKHGVCDEAEWPYDCTKFTQEPPAACYQSALAHRAIAYSSLAGRRHDLEACLADGYPFVFGMSVYSNFCTAQVSQTGVGAMPGLADTLMGGHAVMATGYDRGAQTFLIRNSCGVSWGMRGYFTLPYDFLESRHLTDNFWTIRRI